MEPTHTFRCVIKPHQDGLTLSEALAQRFPYLCHAEWQQLISSGAVQVNNSIATPNLLLKTGDQLATQIKTPDEPFEVAKIPLAHETESFLLAEKPAGMPVSRTGLIVHNTLINCLRRQQNNNEIQLMHRLDQETSGLLLCARNRLACKKWQQHLTRIMPRKLYLAVVSGKIQLANHLVELPLLEKKDNPIRCRMYVDPAGKASATTLHTLAANQDCSLVLAELHTGRKHQIRAHLSHLGHPILGDKIYSHDGHYFLTRFKRELTTDDFAVLKATNHTLHAWAMVLNLPDSKPHLYYSLNFSPDMQRYLAMFEDWQGKAKEGLIQLGIKEELLETI